MKKQSAVQTGNSTTIGTLTGVLTLFIWSASAMLIYLSGDVPPLQLAAIVNFLAASLYVIKWIIKRENPMRFLVRANISDLILLCSGLGFYSACYYVALKTAPVMEANFLNYLWPVLLVGFSAIVQKTPLKTWQILGLLTSFSGAAILLVFKTNQDLTFASGFQWSHILGYGLAITAAIIWAGYSALTSKRKNHPDMMFFAFFFAAILSFFLHLYFEDTQMPSPNQWIIICVMGSATLSYALWDWSMKNGDVQIIASLSYFIPLFSTILLIFVTGGALALSSYIGGGLIIAGALLANLHRLIPQSDRNAGRAES